MLPGGVEREREGGGSTWWWAAENAPHRKNVIHGHIREPQVKATRPPPLTGHGMGWTDHSMHVSHLRGPFGPPLPGGWTDHFIQILDKGRGGNQGGPPHPVRIFLPNANFILPFFEGAYIVLALFCQCVYQCSANLYVAEPNFRSSVFRTEWLPVSRGPRSCPRTTTRSAIKCATLSQ